MVTKTYTSAVELTKDTWKYGSKKQKEEILESLGYDKSWAETKSINEMVRRGGGLVARGLLKLEKAYLKANGGKITITW